MKSSRGETGAAASNLAREGATREYLKSREVYRGLQGTILVDAFRFVSHGPTHAEWTCRGPRSAPHSSDGAGASWTVHSPTAPVLNQEPRVPSTARAARAHTFYFLSHFHCDHYTGITNRWHSDTIYCSRPTAALAQSQLGVPASCLFPMDLRQTYIFSLPTGVCLERVAETPHHSHVQALLSPQATASKRLAGAKDGDDVFAVRLIPANHCPGAVMFLFVSSLFGTVLHTGDFRFHGSRETWRQFVLSPNRGHTYVPPQPCLIDQKQALRSSTAVTPVAVMPPTPFYEQFIADDEALQEVAQRQLLDVLFLDNTFCAPPYKFPSQWEVTQTLIGVLRSLFCRASRAALNALPSSGHAPRRQVRCAVLIGCYTIGKERVALALRDAFPLARPSEQRLASDPAVESPNDIIVPQPASWRIHVSPSRYAVLSSMQFFEHCFQPLKAVSVSEGAVAPHNANGEASLRPLRKMAHVEDVPVLLPVVLGECNANGARPQFVPGSLACKSEDTDATPASAETRSFAVDFDSMDWQRSSSSAEEVTAEAEHFLSVFLVPMGCVGYQAVTALAHTNGPAVVNIEDELMVNLDPYDQVLIVQPTGWCKRCATRDVSEKITFLRLAYSEHCAFHELLQFVGFVNPARVVPTVSEESFKQQEALFVEKAPRLQSRVSNVQPITRFFPVLSLYREAPRGENRNVMVASPPSSQACALLGGSSVALVGATSVDETAVDDTRTTVVSYEKGRKRARAAQDASAVAAPASTTTLVTATSTNTCTLERLFQKVKRDAACRSSATQRRKERVVSEEDDCQVVRVVPTVVEISDDD
ncbi:hypothetical protein GH5_02042 [Leishmania sp. Ghana 2012 LV757]|uniref:hypothetical protein n=1 Tax=Leishmania sp. Ghana 2012 LV757 TaxID=2803181 RepID=UPI001B415E47|nr:hypothetical protein GH5_02042 [Leishmania sp. Ghana 2012 LV757]